MIFGWIFAYMRRRYVVFMQHYYKRKYKGIHPSAQISYEVLIYSPVGNLSIGEGTYIQRGSSLTGPISIGKYCAISSNVNLRAKDHGGGKGALHTNVSNKIVIGDYVWIGVNAFIKSGVRIGNNSIIGANSVVLNDVPENSVVAGVPAKVVKKLNFSN